jgi:hypothetical protein
MVKAFFLNLPPHTKEKALAAWKAKREPLL